LLLVACVVCRGFAVEVAARLVSADWLWNTTAENTTTNSSDINSSNSSSGEADGATLFEVIVARWMSPLLLAIRTVPVYQTT
jgi:hypothetical protein